MIQWDKSIGFLEKALDASWLKLKVISNNIANSDTPGFKSSSVLFEDVLNEATNKAEPVQNAVEMKKTRQGHQDGESLSSGSSAVVVQQNNSSMRVDGNDVDLENEMVQLAKNNIYYNTLVQTISKEFSKIRSAINEGK